MTDGVHFRWLGVAGVELEFGGERLLIDPYLSRVPLRYLFCGRPQPDRDLVMKHLSPARAVLVTHPHFDHLLDVPIVCGELGAAAYGSPNTAALLLAHGLPAEKIRITHPGELFHEGPYSVEVFAGEHPSIAGIIPHAEPLRHLLHPPLKLGDYRMDFTYSYRVSAGGSTILFWNSPASSGVPQSDFLVLTTSRRPEIWNDVIAKAKPKAIILIHWDDFFSPLTRPIRPMLAPPRLGDRLFARMDPRAFARSMQKMLPEGKIFIPEIFHSVELIMIQ
jgi:L-ascorbate metabolism protein UlaG (beta-lactamase superfamily)